MVFANGRRRTSRALWARWSNLGSQAVEINLGSVLVSPGFYPGLSDVDLKNKGP